MGYDGELEKKMADALRKFRAIKKEREEALARDTTQTISNMVMMIVYQAEVDKWHNAHRICCKLREKLNVPYHVVNDVIDEMVTNGELEVLVVEQVHTKTAYVRRKLKVYISSYKGHGISCDNCGHGEFTVDD